MLEGIKAVAFDIDGTLYPDWKLYVRILPYFFRNFRFYTRFNRVRKVMHRTAPLADFYEYQARLLGAVMHITSSEAKSKIQSICYDGMIPYFKKIRPYPGVVECIKSMKDAGLKIGILSDFPPYQKGDLWGIRELSDVCIGSEESGALKPSKYPFGILSIKLEVKPEEILYVGNSVKYDVLKTTGDFICCPVTKPDTEARNMCILSFGRIGKRNTAFKIKTDLRSIQNRDLLRGSG